MTRALTDELNGDDQGTKMTPTPLRVDWWHNRDQLQRCMSMTMAMADTVARLRYAGDRSSVTMKQTTRVEPGAHPEHTGVMAEPEKQRRHGSMVTAVTAEQISTTAMLR